MDTAGSAKIEFGVQPDKVAEVRGGEVGKIRHGHAGIRRTGENFGVGKFIREDEKLRQNLAARDLLQRATFVRRHCRWKLILVVV